jgi:hypothetical protein
MYYYWRYILNAYLEKDSKHYIVKNHEELINNF